MTTASTINSKWGLGERVVQGVKMPEQIVFRPDQRRHEDHLASG